MPPRSSRNEGETMKLSKPQQSQPLTCSRASVRWLSAWHRTADSLQRLGLVIKERRGGNMYRVRLKKDHAQ